MRPPTEAQGPGTYYVTVRVADTGSGPHRKDIPRLTVNEVNSAPFDSSTSAPQVIDEGSLLSFPIAATDPDLPRQTLTYSLDPGSPRQPETVNAQTGVFSWTPTEDQGPGTFSIAVRATDFGSPSLSGTATIHVTVNEVNTKPVLATIPAKAVDEGPS